MEKTTNYQLNQWEVNDRVQRTDFNADNAKIDAALAGKAEAADLAALSQTVAGKGNCRIVAGTYTGTGTFGSGALNTLKFSFKPALVILMGGGWVAFMTSGMSTCRILSGPIHANWALTWSGNSLSWYVTSAEYSNYRTYEPNAECQMNQADIIYHYIAIA